MIRSRVPLFLIPLLLLCAPLRGGDLPAATSPYENPEFGFTLSLPEGWSIKEGVFGAALAAVAPDAGGGFHDNLTVSAEDLPPLMKAEDYLDLERERLSAVPSLREVSSETVRCGDLPARRAVFSLKEGSEEYRTVIYLVQAGRKMFVLAGTSLAGGGGKGKEGRISLFDEVFRSFRLGKPARAGRAVKRIRDRAKGFSIEFPGDWEVTENLQGTTLIAFSPLSGEKDPFRENVNVLVESLEAPTPIGEYARAQVGTFRASIEGFNGLSEEEARIGGLAAKRIRYRHRLGERELEALAYLLVKGRRGYVVTAAGEAGAFADHEPAFRKICESLRLE